MPQAASETLTGIIERVVFRNEDTGFSVLELGCEDELFTVVGELPGVFPGETLCCSGSFVSHPVFGVQFRSVFFTRTMPRELGAISDYLSSGAVKGIGPVTAARIVDRFGGDALEIIMKAPERLQEIRGISRGKARDISAQLREQFGVGELINFLTPFGVMPRQCSEVFRLFGAEALALCQSNPYVLCGEPVRLPFPIADAIAQATLSDGGNRLVAGVAFVLEHNGRNGHTCLPQHKLAAAAAELLQSDTDTIDRVIDEGVAEGRLRAEELGSRRYIFLPWTHQSQRFIAQRLSILTDYFPDNGISYQKAIDRLEKKLSIRYADRQREAIEMSLRGGITILTGGPGTGKTTAMAAIIELFEGEGLAVSLAAPTGRAAKKLSEVTGRDAKTLHRLLEVEFTEGGRPRFARGEQNPLPCDVVILDELSMVDTLLFEALLRAMPLHCRLVLVGDADQLPSVGSGNLLRDLLESGLYPTVSLREIFRQAAESLIVLSAHRIIGGEMPELAVRDRDFFFIETANDRDTAELVRSLCCERLPARYGFSPVDDIQVLSPTRKGECGTERLNQLLRERLNPAGDDRREFAQFGVTYREGDKVMQIKNNYDLRYTRGAQEAKGIFNGDIGEIEELEPAHGVMRIAFDDRVCEYPMASASELEHAYAITVHKSQGSEFPAVVIPISARQNRLYYRSLLYTAVTRARKLLILVGSREGLAAMVRNDRRALRYTLLRPMLCGEVGTDA